jgi:hypothetical protein
MLKPVNLLFDVLILKPLITMELLKPLRSMNRNRRFRDQFLRLPPPVIEAMLPLEIWVVSKKEWKFSILYIQLKWFTDLRMIMSGLRSPRVKMMMMTNRDIISH